LKDTTKTFSKHPKAGYQGHGFDNELSQQCKEDKEAPSTSHIRRRNKDFKAHKEKVP
jgi:hypothetical protein